MSIDEILFAIAVIYFAPGVTASIRRHHNAQAIWATNILLGWTGFGWCVAYIWACTNPGPKALPATPIVPARPIEPNYAAPPPLPTPRATDEDLAEIAKLACERWEKIDK